ncbi:uncharacterized protein IL334_004404 [Kwoniella shivajii]|uniref:Uncharacterized protein n=1 Tax=Kwoniella shivajii TaxID=564305 RepID=A0ABZ1D090_9TREE|nr:hypothetical protein IL334_004404 [Kwoniella shivajii]
MKYLQRRRIFQGILLLLLSSITYYLYSSITASPQRFKGAIPFEDELPLITLIAFFDGAKIGPSLLPYFFRSIGQQPHALDLLIVQRNGCSDIKGWTRGMENIKHVCLSEKQFWGQHTEYFCKKWGGCSRMQRKTMLADMTSYGRIRDPHAHYRMLRGWVFERYVKPETAYWGFVDFDTLVGDFSQTFPYDLLEQDYDIIAPSEPNDNGGKRLIFMRGHMTFIRNRKETETKILGYPDFSSFEEWDKRGLKPYPNSIAEGTYSSYVIREPSINILSFDGLAFSSQPHKFSPAGVLLLPESFSLRGGEEAPQALSPSLVRALMTRALRLPTTRSYTSYGIERSITVHHQDPADRKLWFPAEFANYYDAERVPEYGHGKIIKWKRYLMKIDGKWSERLEPMREFRDIAEEALHDAYGHLYVHHQEDKRQAHFKEFPQSPIGDIFINYMYNGNALYDSDSGQRLVWRPKRPQQCCAWGCVELDEVPIPDRIDLKEWRQGEKDRKEWWAKSKQIRLGYSTETLPADPGVPTPPTFTRLLKEQ